MKKLLLIAATSTALLTSAASFAETGGFYVKAEGGATKLNAMKFKDDNGKSGNIKYKSTNSGIFGVGVGYYIMDNVRTELTLNFLTNPEFKGSYTKESLKVESKAKESVKSLLLSGYVDLYDAGVVKFFAGAGVGMAQLQQKLTSTETTTTNGKAETKTYDPMSCKTANNFAYQLSVGASFNLADNMNLDLTYSWRDYGETSDKAKDKNYKLGKSALRGHNLMAGIRFDI
ncbi:MAG: outer membrane beta-barrel protein [Rickettsia endosymbiont of Labidopullus appendiculatus]|nr:outer membrane beta-barrel protein [Rickettsia endosymbiont of Labidopullus appendiculatus]